MDLDLVYSAITELTSFYDKQMDNYYDIIKEELEKNNMIHAQINDEPTFLTNASKETLRYVQDTEHGNCCEAIDRYLTFENAYFVIWQVEKRFGEDAFKGFLISKF